MGAWWRAHVLITLNNRLAMAAAAIVTKMVILSTPRVLLPVLPDRNGSSIEAAMIDSRHSEQYRQSTLKLSSSNKLP